MENGRMDNEPAPIVLGLPAAQVQSLYFTAGDGWERNPRPPHQQPLKKEKGTA